MGYRWIQSVVVLLSLLSMAAEASPDVGERTLEVGLGIGALVTSDYRGSKTYRHHIAPIPYVIYRGKIFRSDRDGVRSDIFRSDQLEFTLSLAASLRPDSDENEQREGMPGLDSTLEIGPAVNVNLTGGSLREGWMVTLPVRAVVTLGRGSPEHIGWLAEPQLLYRKRQNGWNWTFRTGPAFATGRHHDYYYAVASEYVRSDRARYDASGGYSGYNNQLAISRRSGQLWYAFFVRYYHLNGANFMDSPLVETNHGGSAGIALSWVLH